MTLIDLLTVLGSLIAVAFTVRFGNRALRDQRIDKRRRQHKETSVEEVEGQETERALRDLELWRKQGYLMATEASWEQLLRLATDHPEAVLELRRIVERYVERTEGQTRKGKPAMYVRIKLADEDSREFRSDLGNGHGRKPKDTLMVQAPLLPA
jgi:hypothetical protein